MEGIGLLIAFCFLITFGPPMLFFVLGLIKRNKGKDSAKVFFILGAIWLIVGGGTCLSIMM